MSDARSPIDESLRRGFERAWLEDGEARLESFLPPRSDPAFEATLVELLCIDMEMRYRNGDPPSIGDYARRFTLDARTRDLLTRERDYLARRSVRAGARVGRYVLREQIGSGAFAEVWRAYDPDLEREVALKRLRPALGDDPEARERFRREALSAARLRHPAIVSVHAVGNDAGGPYLVADLIRGRTLREALRESTPTPRDAASLVARLAGALDYAHEFGIVHRDVKPGNVLLDQAGTPLLTDFGLASLGTTEATLTHHGQLLGTPAYMSPEQARGDIGAIDRRSDVYSLGIVLYELLTGRVPFGGTDQTSLAYAVVHRDVPRPRRAGAALPADLETICLKATAREPARRYQTAGAFADDLRRFLDGEPITARRAGPVRRLSLWTRRNPLVAASLATVLVVIGIAFHGVSSERTRYRDAHAASQANLYRSLTRQAEVQLALPRGAGRAAAWATIAEAAGVETRSRDTLELRNLALRYLTARGPHFRRKATWVDPLPAITMALAPDGSRLVEASADGVRIRDAASGATVHAIPGPAQAVAIDPRGGRVAIGQGRRVRILDLASSSPLITLECARPPVAMAFDTRSDALATGSADGPVEVWDLAVSPPGPALSRRVGVQALAFSEVPHGLVMGRVDDKIQLIEVPHGRVVWTTDYDEPVRALATGYLRIGAIGWRRLAFTIVDGQTGGLRQAQTGHDASIRGIHFAPHETVVTAAADGTLAAFDTELARVAEFRTGAPVQLAAGAGTHVVTLDAEGRRTVWEVAFPEGHRAWDAHHAAVFVPGTYHLFDGIAPFDCRDGTFLPHALPARSSQVWGVAVSPDGRRAVTTAHDGAVELLDVPAFSRVRQLVTKGATAWAAAFAPDARRLATGSGSAIDVWNAETGDRLRTLEGHARMVSALAFLGPTRLASASRDGTVRLWDLEEGTEVARLLEGVVVHDLERDGDRLLAACDDGAIRVLGEGAGPGRRIDVDAHPVWAVAVGPDGIVATGSQDGRVRLWRRAPWRTVAVLDGVPRVRTLAFHPDGHYLAASAYVVEGRVWDLAWLRRELAKVGLDWE